MCGLRIVLITEKSVGKIKCIDEQYYLEDFYTPVAEIYKHEKKSVEKFRDGFWKKTTERFYVLEQFMSIYEIGSAFHAELDNLVFNIESLYQKFNEYGSGVFSPRDANDRGIASLIYVNHVPSLKCITEFDFRKHKHIKNDMDLLGYLLANNQSNYHSLPTESSLSNENEWNFVDYKYINGIFDAAAIGQYLFGADHRILCQLISFNGFKNENLKIDLNEYQIEINLISGLSRLVYRKDSTAINLYNIHVHSKVFKQINDKRRLKNILNNINSNSFIPISYKPIGFIVCRFKSLLLQFIRKTGLRKD